MTASLNHELVLPTRSCRWPRRLGRRQCSWSERSTRPVGRPLTAIYLPCGDLRGYKRSGGFQGTAITDKYQRMSGAVCPCPESIRLCFSAARSSILSLTQQLLTALTVPPIASTSSMIFHVASYIRLSIK